MQQSFVYVLVCSWMLASCGGEVKKEAQVNEEQDTNTKEVLVDYNILSLSEHFALISKLDVKKNTVQNWDSKRNHNIIHNAS